MTRFALAPFTALLALTLLVAGCGQTRETDASPVSTEPPTTVTTAAVPVDTNPQAAAVTITYANGDVSEITNADLADYATASLENAAFVDALLGGSAPPGFAQGTLSAMTVERTIDRAMVVAGASAGDAEIETARTALVGELATYLPDAADPQAAASDLIDQVPYLRLLVDLRSKEAALGTALAADSEGEEVPCVRHILVETVEEADDILAQLDGGGDFATLAGQYSLDPGSKPDGGDLGCLPSSSYVPEFANAVDNATVGEVVGPVESAFGQHIIVVYDYDVAPVDNAQVAYDVWSKDLLDATVEVAPGIGTWDPSTLTIRPA